MFEKQQDLGKDPSINYETLRDLVSLICIWLKGPLGMLYIQIAHLLVFYFEEKSFVRIKIKANTCLLNRHASASVAMRIPPG